MFSHHKEKNACVFNMPCFQPSENDRYQIVWTRKCTQLKFLVVSRINMKKNTISCVFKQKNAFIKNIYSNLLLKDHFSLSKTEKWSRLSQKHLFSCKTPYILQNFFCFYSIKLTFSSKSNAPD